MKTITLDFKEYVDKEEIYEVICECPVCTLKKVILHDNFCRHCGTSIFWNLINYDGFN